MYGDLIQRNVLGRQDAKAIPIAADIIQTGAPIPYAQQHRVGRGLPIVQQKTVRGRQHISFRY